MSISLRAVLALLLAVGSLGCIQPRDQRPGLRLRGPVAAELPTDWSFANEHREIALQVGTPYLLPHSVTVWCASGAGELYLGARNPDDKRWPGWVARKPEVRLGIGGQVYEVALSVIEDTGQIAQVRRAYAAKYGLPDPAPADSPPMRYWRVVPRS